MIAVTPAIRQNKCLNKQIPESSEESCDFCQRICPANAIDFSERQLPRLDENACTGCTACVHVCPADAITHQEMDVVNLVQQASGLARQGKTELHAACAKLSDSPADLRVPCHAAWDPMLLASFAAEGIRTLHLNGIRQCASCPARHGAEIMTQTEKDYATINKALSVRLSIAHTEAPAPRDVSQPSAPEPARRAFFRNLIPSMAQSASMAAAQISQATSQAMRQESGIATSAPSGRPVRLQLFLRALPKLQANFTPIPAMPGLPLGAIQADDKCTACDQCVEQCPTQALSIREFGSNKILEFQPDGCIGCRQCVGICPEEALTSLPGISLPALLAKRARPLVMVRPEDRAGNAE